MRNKTLSALVAIGFLTIISSQAKAQSVGGALQLGLGTNLITYSSTNITQHDTPINNQGDLGNVETIDRNTTWGVGSRNGVGLEAGYGINDNLVIGGMLDLAGWSNTQGPRAMSQTDARDKQSVFSLFVGPKLDYMLLPDSVVRPFFGVGVGLVRRSDTRYSIGLDNNGANLTRRDVGAALTGLGLVGRAGIRWFLTPGFSIDPAFVLGFHTLSGSAEYPAGNATRSYDMNATGYTVGLRLGFSGWIGL